jgi:uncharacterized protein YndB with AHSA1/START domain
MTTSDTKLQLKKFIRATPQRVFDAWTKPSLMKQWFAPGTMTVPDAQADMRVGGAYKVTMNNADETSPMPTGTYVTYGVYKEIVPNSKLVFTWGWEGPDRHESIVTVEFQAKDGGTEVILTHERLANAEQVQKHTHGWLGCLENLATRIGQQPA